MKEPIEIVSYVEFIFLAISAICFLIAIYYAGEAESTLDLLEQEQLISAKTENSMSKFLIIGLIVIGVILLISAVLAVILYKGVRNRDKKKLKIWYYTHAVILVLLLCSIVIKMFGQPFIVLECILPTVYRGWTLWVVRKFMKKLQEEEACGGGDSGFQSVPQGSEVKWTH